MKNGDTYTCAACGGVFTTDWDDEDANQERDALWTAEELSEGTALVCDSCWEAGMTTHFQDRLVRVEQGDYHV